MKAPGKSALEYVRGIETRHNMSCDDRSCGKHIHGMPEVTDVAEREQVPITSGESGLGGKGGRGQGTKAKSNFGPGRD